MGDLVVWGYARSWIVHRVNNSGIIVWASHWMATKSEADQLKARMGGKA